jgi:hypothetical protein
MSHVWAGPWQDLPDAAAASVGCSHVSGPVCAGRCGRWLSRSPRQQCTQPGTIFGGFDLGIVNDDSAFGRDHMSDIDTLAVDSLKARDPKLPIREGDNVGRLK